MLLFDTVRVLSNVCLKIQTRVDRSIDTKQDDPKLWLLPLLSQERWGWLANGEGLAANKPAKNAGVG